MNNRVATVLLCAVLCGPNAYPADNKMNIAINDAWSPTAPPGATVHAGYFALENRSDGAIHIIGIESPLFRNVSLHRTEMENGQMTMVPLDSLRLNPHERIVLEPGGTHLMLFGPKKSLVSGERIPVSIILEGNARREFFLVVKKWQ